MIRLNLGKEKVALFLKTIRKPTITSTKAFHIKSNSLCTDAPSQTNTTIPTATMYNVINYLYRLPVILSFALYTCPYVPSPT